METSLVNKIFNISSANSFEPLALEVFRFQAMNNPVYKQYINILNISIDEVKQLSDIPFLPIAFFKTHQIYIGNSTPEVVFTSSGTTGTEMSKHPVRTLNIYERSFIEAFNIYYGTPEKYCILALLPSYLERSGSSLIYMAQHLISKSNNPHSGFFLDNYDELIDILIQNENNGQPTILLGVTFALLELAARKKLSLKNAIVMETGGMKGRGKELTRGELHGILKDRLGVTAIHSEYGMTELLSQAYSSGNGIFTTPPWMSVLTRDPYDPFCLLPTNSAGAINIIDLANVYSCSFIQTDDLGKVNSDGSFEISGRMDGSQVRGCNLLVL